MKDNYYSLIIYDHLVPYFWKDYLSMICPDFFYCHHSGYIGAPDHSHVLVHFPRRIDFYTVCSYFNILHIPHSVITRVHDVDAFLFYCKGEK